MRAKLFVVGVIALVLVAASAGVKARERERGESGNERGSEQARSCGEQR